MKIVIDQKKVNRYRKIGQYTSLAALVVLLGGFVLAMTQIVNTFQASSSSAPVLNERMLTYSYVAMFVGLVLTQVSLYFGNRWGRRESVDQTLSNSLKGLDDRYTLFHYTAPVPHLLVGPSGIWVLAPMYQAGSITFAKNRYRQSGVRFFSRFFGQEGIGRPDLEAESYLQDINRYIEKHLKDASLAEPGAAIIFTNPKAILQVEEAPYPTISADKFKDFIRRKAKEQMATSEKIKPLLDLLPKPD
jgi:hypothetical protein